MKVLIACEYSGIVRDAFISKGHDAISCDLLPTESIGPHYQGDIFTFLQDSETYDLIIAHPPCTALCVSGNGTYAKGKEKHQDRIEAITWTENLWNLCKTKAKRVCFENPVGVLTTKSMLPKPQYVHPWQFGHMEQKKTALFLHNLSELKPTHDVYKEMMLLPKKERNRIHYLGGGSGHERSKTYTGIAQAMAEQWNKQDKKK